MNRRYGKYRKQVTHNLPSNNTTVYILFIIERKMIKVFINHTLVLVLRMAFLHDTARFWIKYFIIVVH